MDKPTSAPEALQLMLNASGFLMEYGRIETGTPESRALLEAYRFFANHFGVGGQRAAIRKPLDSEFTFVPRD